MGPRSVILLALVRDGASTQRAQSSDRNVLGRGDPHESAERSILFRVGGGKVREDFLEEVITELIWK